MLRKNPLSMFSVPGCLVPLMSLLCFVLSSPTFAQTASETECTSYNINLQDLAKNKSVRLATSGFDQLEGKTIRHIHYQQLSVFDENNPDENNRLYLFLNSLHFTTREKVVRSQLLFKEGEQIDHHAMDETGRILRTRKYFSYAQVLPETLCGNLVDVMVITQDSWAIEPQFSYSNKGNKEQTGFAISDGNIAGTGNALTIGYTENNLRKTVSYDFKNPYFLNQKIALHLLHEDTTDGRNTIAEIAHPFYSLDTPWATGAGFSDLSLTELIYSRGKVINEFVHHAIDNDVYVGKATDVTEQYTQRWLLGFTESEENFHATPDTLLPIPEDDKAQYPWVEYQYIENKFSTFKNINQIQHLEDILLGQTVTARLGAAGKNFHNPDDVLRYNITYKYTVDFSSMNLLSIAAQYESSEHSIYDNLNNRLFTSSVAYHYLENEKRHWFASFEYGHGDNLPQYKQLTTGLLTGLRGYPLDYLRGEKREVFTLERRYYSDYHLFNLLRVGGVIFFDTGKAWGLPNELGSERLANLGIGLRLSPTKVRVGNVIHADISMPTIAKTGLSQYQLTIGAFELF